MYVGREGLCVPHQLLLPPLLHRQHLHPSPALDLGPDAGPGLDVDWRGFWDFPGGLLILLWECINENSFYSKEFGLQELFPKIVLFN